MGVKHRLKDTIVKYQRHIAIVIFPLLLLPLLVISNEPAAQCAYVLLLMACYYASCALPPGVTSLLPVLLLPPMGLITSARLCSIFINQGAITNIGTVTVGLVIERTGLHRRVCINVLKRTGVSPYALLLGFGFSAFLLSMWIANIAVIVTLVAVAQSLFHETPPPPEAADVFQNGGSDLSAVLNSSLNTNDPHTDQSTTDNSAVDNKSRTRRSRAKMEGREEIFVLKGFTEVESGADVGKRSYVIGHDLDGGDKVNPADDSDGNKTGTDLAPTPAISARWRQLHTLVVLSVRYGALLGGVSCPTGMPTALIAFEIIEEYYAAAGLTSPLTFPTWIASFAPVMLLAFLAVMTAYQLVAFRDSFPCKKKPETDEAGDHIKKWLAEEDKKLGPIRSGEVSAALLLLLLIVLWFFLRPGFMPGWADALFPPGYVGSSAVAILVLTLAFLIPIGGDRDGGDNDAAGGAAPRPVEALMTWPHMRTHFPWELVLIMGAGNALSTVANESGLSAWLGEQLAGLDGLGPWPLVLSVCLLLTFLTEVFSDTLLVYIMLPVVADMSVRLGYSPLFLVVPVTMSIITAFMMPHIIGNVVILATGALSVRTLMKIGFVADIVVSFVYTIATNTWLIPLLDLHTLPPEFLPNSTSPDAGNITLVM